MKGACNSATLYSFSALFICPLPEFYTKVYLWLLSSVGLWKTWWFISLLFSIQEPSIRLPGKIYKLQWHLANGWNTVFCHVVYGLTRIHSRPICRFDVSSLLWMTNRLSRNVYVNVVRPNSIGTALLLCTYVYVILSKQYHSLQQQQQFPLFKPSLPDCYSLNIYTMG